MPSHPSFDLFCRFSLFELPLCVGSQRLTDGFRSKQSRKAKIQLDCSEARSFSSACLGENCTAKDPAFPFQYHTFRTHCVSICTVIIMSNLFLVEHFIKDRAGWVSKRLSEPDLLVFASSANHCAFICANFLGEKVSFFPIVQTHS